MADSVNLWQALLLTGIPTAGTVASVIIQSRRNAAQARDSADREDRRRIAELAQQLELAKEEHAHQLSLERAKFLRDERRILHANALRAAREVLELWGRLASANKPSPKFVANAQSALENWNEARAEADLFASDAVREALAAVNSAVTKRRFSRSMAALDRATAKEPETTPNADSLMEKMRQGFEADRKAGEENRVLLKELLHAVRADLEVGGQN